MSSAHRLGNDMHRFRFCVGYILAIVMGLCATGAAAQITTRTVGIKRSQAIESPDIQQCVFLSQDSKEGPVPPARMEHCYEWTTQQWRVDGDAQKGYRIWPRTRGEYCLTVSANELTGRVVRAKCSSSLDLRQRWAIVPIRGSFEKTQYVVFSKYAVDTYGSPLVLTAATEHANVTLAPFQAGDGQLPRATQLWVSQEMYCYLTYGTHANGLTEITLGPSAPKLYVPNCPE